MSLFVWRKSHEVELSWKPFLITLIIWIHIVNQNFNYFHISGVNTIYVTIYICIYIIYMYNMYNLKFGLEFMHLQIVLSWPLLTTFKPCSVQLILNFRFACFWKISNSVAARFIAVVMNNMKILSDMNDVLLTLCQPVISTLILGIANFLVRYQIWTLISIRSQI